MDVFFIFWSFAQQGFALGTVKVYLLARFDLSVFAEPTVLVQITTCDEIYKRLDTHVPSQAICDATVGS